MFLPSWMVMDERVQAHTHFCFYYVRRQSAQYVIADDENQCGFHPDSGCMLWYCLLRRMSPFIMPPARNEFTGFQPMGGWRMLFREGETSCLKFVLPFIVLNVGGLNDVLIFFFPYRFYFWSYSLFPPLPHIFHIYILRSDVFLMNLNEGLYSLSFKALFVR